MQSCKVCSSEYTTNNRRGFFLGDIMVECHIFGPHDSPFPMRQEWNPKFRCRVNSVPTWVLKLDLYMEHREIQADGIVMKEPQVP